MRFKTAVGGGVAALAGVSLVAVVSASGPKGAAPATAQPFTRDVAPILYTNCTTCHRPGEIAPTPRVTDDDLRPDTTDILEDVSQGRGLPRRADAPAGTFGNERRLSDAEQAIEARPGNRDVVRHIIGNDTTKPALAHTPVVRMNPERQQPAVPGAAGPDTITTPITFDREIRAILRARCASCHAPGAPAPMPFTTYEDVRPWARGIKDQILARRMPIWHAAHGYGSFANDPSLTPAEMAAIVSWVDGGQPKSANASGFQDAPGSPRAFSPLDPVVSAFRRQAPALAIPVSASAARLRLPSAWIAGWYVEPGDPLVTSATLTSADGTAIGTWVAGDGPVTLPAESAVAVISPIRVTIQRRAAAGYETPFTPKRSLLRVVTLAEAPKRRVWVERAACGAPRTARNASVLGVRPLLASGASARLWLERPGAPRTILGWFRGTDARYLRTYWLARPADLPPESRVQSDAACDVELTLTTR